MDYDFLKGKEDKKSKRFKQLYQVALVAIILILLYLIGFPILLFPGQNAIPILNIFLVSWILLILSIFFFDYRKKIFSYNNKKFIILRLFV